MRIGIDARMYGPKSTTGIGNYIQKLTDSLFLIDKKNEYILFMLEPGYSEFTPPNKRIEKVMVTCPWYSWSEQRQMPKILLRHKLDLVHFPHFNVPIFYPKKFLVTIHDITPRFFPGPKVKKSLIRKFGYQAALWSGIKRSKKIITVSNHTKNNLIKFFKAPADKIKVTYLGVEKYFKVIDDREAIQRVKDKYRITKPFIFYIGVWRDHKNLPGLIKSFEILKSNQQFDFQLVLGGKPDPAYPEIQRALNLCRFKADIILPGFIPETELPLFYNAAELFVLPSYCEGFGLVALESLACGTPVIASKSTSLPEILADSALYFNPDSPKDIAQLIKKITSDPVLYEDLQTRGSETVKKYTWPECAEKTLAIYESV